MTHNFLRRARRQHRCAHHLVPYIEKTQEEAANSPFIREWERGPETRQGSCCRRERSKIRRTARDSRELAEFIFANIINARE